jgi:hypothetical protein
MVLSVGGLSEKNKTRWHTWRVGGRRTKTNGYPGEQVVHDNVIQMILNNTNIAFFRATEGNRVSFESLVGSSVFATSNDKDRDSPHPPPKSF